MRIEKIFIRNFRSIGEEGLTINLSQNLTTIVGENNVGKSSIFEAVKKILEESTQWNKEDWHAGDQNKTIEIQIECILDDEQIRQILAFWEVSDVISSDLIDSFKENFTNKLTYVHTKKVGHTDTLYKFGDLNIDTWYGWTGNKAKKEQINYRELFGKIKKDKNFFTEFRHILGTHEILFQNRSNEHLHIILNKGIIIINEFREKPHNSLSDFLSTSTGLYLASVLHNLQTGRDKPRREGFKQIQKVFHKFFPTLELEIAKENINEIRILTQKSDIDSTTQFIGSGVLETLLIITHLIAHDEKAILVDTPELHLHPHIQRRLGSFIEEMSKNSQMVLITHSPYFVSLNKNNKMLRIVQETARTKTIELPQDYLTDSDFSKLEQFLDIDAKELFFARKVLLVEGPTEIGALPIFASHNGYNFDENGVTLITVDGKLSFKIFLKLCEGFKTPYFIVADKDAEAGLADIAPKLILPSTFDELLPLELREEARKVLGIHKQGQGKPRIGRYVAKKMIADGREIPNEIKHIVTAVKNL